MHSVFEINWKFRKNAGFFYITIYINLATLILSKNVNKNEKREELEKENSHLVIMIIRDGYISKEFVKIKILILTFKIIEI